MDTNQIMKIFDDTAYIRMGGTVEELKAAEYLKSCCAAMGLDAKIEGFEVEMAAIQEAVLLADGISIPCKGYFLAGSGTVEAPFYYLRDFDPVSLAYCKGKIVMVDGHMRYWMYQDLVEHGAVGFITYDGNANYADRDIDQKELRPNFVKDKKLLGVNINAKDAIALVDKGVTGVKITLRQHEYKGQSHNVILDLPGETDEYIAFTAHYDTTSLSQGAYDNMSGSVGILAIAEHFFKHPHRYGLRFIWCGSEERGLLGAKAYCAKEGVLDKCVLNINLDMIGCIMGRFAACCTTEEAAVTYIKYFASEIGFPIYAYQDVYSSDSTPFADKGVPAISFARWAPNNTATIHNSYDTVAVMSSRQMVEDIDFLIAFSERMANAKHMPVAKTMPDNMKDKLDIYLCRKRAPQK